MQIRDFSLPTPYFTPMPCRSDCEERTADLQQACEKNDWGAAICILEKGSVDPAVRKKVIFDALAKTHDMACAILISAARSIEPFDAATDSQILVMAAKRNLEGTVRTQLKYGLVQPWAIRDALDIAKQLNARDLENPLREWNR